MTNIGTGNGYVFLPTIWSKEVTKAFEKNRVMAKLVSRFDADVKESGQTVKIPNLANITATYKVSGAAVDMYAATNSTVTLTIDKWASKGVTVDDIVKVQSSYPLMKYFAEKLGSSVAKIQDDDLMSLYSSFSSTIGATSSNVGLAKSFILGAIRTLDAADVPGAERSFVVDAYGYEDLRNMDEFTRYDATGKAGKFEDGSTRGKFFGVDIYMTNNCPVTTSLVTGLMFHKEAIAMAEQRAIRIQNDYQPRYLDTAVIADLLYGVVARRTDAAIRVQYGQI